MYAAFFAFQPLRSRPPRRCAAFRFGLLHRGGSAGLRTLAELRSPPAEPGIPFPVSRRMLQSVNRWPKPRSSARSSSAIRCRKWGRTPSFHHRFTVWGVGPQAAGDLRPRQVRFLLEAHQALREIVGEDVGSSAVVCALSRHGRRSFRRSSHGPSPAGASRPPGIRFAGRQPKRTLPLPPVLLPQTWDNPLRAERCPPVLPSAAGLRCAEPSPPPALAQIPHLRLLGWLLWAYSRCGVSTGVLIGLCAASLRGLATVSRQLWSLSG